MRVKIVQLDGPMMNLALSKIARHHVNQGDTVSFNEPNPEIIYYGAIFDWTVKKWRHQSVLGNAKVVVGGYPFNDDQLPPEIDALMPLYDLWGTDYSWAIHRGAVFASAGSASCPRRRARSGTISP